MTIILQKKKLQEGPPFLHLLWAFCQDLEFQVALTGRKKDNLDQKKPERVFKL